MAKNTKIEEFTLLNKAFEKAEKTEKNIEAFKTRAKKIFDGIDNLKGSLNSRIKDCNDVLRIHGIKSSLHDNFKNYLIENKADAVEESNESEFTDLFEA